MLFTIIVLAIVITGFVILKKKMEKPSSTPVHQPVEETSVPTMIEEPQIEVETVPTVKAVPTTPPSAPTMVAKKKKPQPKKKPAKANA